MQLDTCLYAQSLDRLSTLLNEHSSGSVHESPAAADVTVLGFFWLVQGWLAEVEERMPSKSDTHRRSGLYETQNSTTVSNNCAQDRERYGML